MKNCKKSIILFMMLVTLSTNFLVGCNKESKAAETSKVNNKGLEKVKSEGDVKGEISFSTWGSLEEKKMNEEIIKAFESKYPGTKVNLEYIPDEYTTKIETMFLGKKAPDVIYGHPRYFTKWAAQGLLMDLTERFNQNSELLDDSLYSTNLYDAFTYDGKKIATINGANTILLYYNKNLFDEAGLDYPNDEWTWEEFIEASKKLTKVENGKPVQFGTMVADWYPIVQTYMFGFGGEWYDDMNNPKKVLFNSEETISGLQLMQDLIYKYKVAPTGLDVEVLGGGFDDGKIAMVLDGAWGIMNRRNIKDFDWDIAYIPKVEGNERKLSALYAGYAVSENTEKPELAWEFAKFMQSDEAQKILAGSGLITVINRSIANSDEILEGEDFPEHNYLRVDSLKFAEHNDSLLINWEETLEKVFNPNIQQLITNTQDAKTTTEKIDEGLRKMLEEEAIKREKLKKK